MEAKISLDVPILYDYSWGYDHSLELNSTMVIDVLAKISGILLKELKIHRDTDDHGNISCSFKWWNHPECDDLKKSLEEWMYKHYRELTGTHDSSVLEYEKLLKGDVDVLTRMAYAHGKRERMLAIAKFIAWICVFDNCMDEPANMGNNVEASRAMVRSLMGIFDMEHDAHQECEHVHHTNDTKNARKPITTIMESAREWWEDMKELGMPITQQKRFVLVLTDYFNASIQQVELRDQRKIPDLLEYTSLRLHTSVCFPLLVLVEFSLGLDLSLDTLHHPLVCALQRAANCHAMFVNDIYSFTKELFDGDLMNLIPILLCEHLNHIKQEHDIDPSHSIDMSKIQQLADMTLSRALEVVQEIDEECVRLIAEIQVSTEQAIVAGTKIEEYVRGISSFIVGNLQWHKHSRRYVVN